MDKQINIGIVGYGNLGKGAIDAIKQQPDMGLVAVFTRREPQSLNLSDPNIKVVSTDEADKYQQQIDVMILCGGSSTDLPEQTPEFAKMFNTVDSFDNHAQIPDYFASIDKVARASGKTSIISAGWDPGTFSLNRVLSEALLPQGETYTFWGKGLSQGHSDAIRRVNGVKNGVQYTIPSEEIMKQVRDSQNPAVSKSERHVRECFVVAEEGADTERIKQDIETMPNYFDEYETTVHFISEAELKKNHAKMPHGGFVIRSGRTGNGNNQIIEYSLNLESNPEFTSSVLVAYARASYRMNSEGFSGAQTVYDVAPKYISPKSQMELHKRYL